MGRRELRTGDPSEDRELFEFGSKLPYVARVRVTINGLDYGTTSGLFEYYDDDLPHGHYVSVDSHVQPCPPGTYCPEGKEYELHALRSGHLPAETSAEIVHRLSHRRAVPGPRDAVVSKMPCWFCVCDVGDERSHHSLPSRPLLPRRCYYHKSSHI